MTARRERAAPESCLSEGRAGPAVFDMASPYVIRVEGGNKLASSAASPRRGSDDPDRNGREPAAPGVRPATRDARGGGARDRGGGRRDRRPLALVRDGPGPGCRPAGLRQRRRRGDDLAV